MAKIGPYEVTEEKLQNIYAERAELAAYKASIEKYPPWPEEEALTFEREGQASTPKSALIPTPTEQAYFARLDQLSGNLISLRDALKQHVNESRNPKGKVAKKYQGIKE